MITDTASPHDADTIIGELRAELRGVRGEAERFRRILEAAPDAIVVVNAAGRIELINAQAESLFGYPREELIGETVEILIPDAMRAQHVHARTAFVNQPEARPMGAQLELFARRKGGRTIPVEISLSPIDTPEGTVVAAAIRDCTDRRMVQAALRNARDTLEQRVRERAAELERANRALQAEMADRHQAEQALYQAQKMEAVGQLTGGIAHDFNNLLTVVTGNLNILARHLAADPFAVELINAATRAAQRGANLNRTLLAFSRRQRLTPSPVSLNDLVEGMADMLRRTLGETVRIEIRPHGDLPAALADPAQLEAALLNLAVNARDAMPLGGTLCIETAPVTVDRHYAALEADLRPGNYVMLAVSDTGVGMTPEVVTRAFEPFFTTKETGKGSGLGLAMVYGFAKQSGGHVKIYSEPGIGTTIKLLLPLASCSEAPREAPAAAPEEHHGLTGSERILVVEDEAEVRALGCRVLASFGYQVVEAADGADGLEIIRRDPAIALLFTDVVLPGGINGPELARQACALRPGLKVLYTSGYTGNAIQQLEALESPVRLLTKPYTIDELARQVRDAIDGT